MPPPATDPSRATPASPRGGAAPSKSERRAPPPMHCRHRRPRDRGAARTTDRAITVGAPRHFLERERTGRDQISSAPALRAGHPSTCGGRSANRPRLVASRDDAGGSASSCLCRIWRPGGCCSAGACTEGPECSRREAVSRPAGGDGTPCPACRDPAGNRTRLPRAERHDRAGRGRRTTASRAAGAAASAAEPAPTRSPRRARADPPSANRADRGAARSARSRIPHHPCRPDPDSEPRARSLGVGRSSPRGAFVAKRPPSRGRAAVTAASPDSRSRGYFTRRQEAGGAAARRL